MDPALRGRRVWALYDPFDPAYVLIEYDGPVVQRALPQKPGETPPHLPPKDAPEGQKTDYLALLREDYKKKTRAELSALKLRTPEAEPELALVDLIALVETCRGGLLSDRERSEVAVLFRKMRPIEPEAARSIIDGLRRRLGTALHLRVYLDALQTALVRQRTTGGKSS